MICNSHCSVVAEVRQGPTVS